MQSVPRRTPRRRANNVNRPMPISTQALETKLVNGPTDPRTTLSDVIFTKVFTTTQVLSSGTATITVGQVGGLIKASGTAPYTYRIQKVGAYASTTDAAFVGVRLAGSDEGSYVDYGTAGSVRPQVHLRPSLEFRGFWHSSSDTASDPLVVLTGGATDTIILQFTLEVRIPLPFT